MQNPAALPEADPNDETHQNLPLSASPVGKRLHGRISEHSLFKIGSEALLHRLVDTLEPRVYNPGDFVIRFGDIGRAMFVIYKGLVEVVSHDGETVLGTLGEGRFFGEVGLLFQVPRIATVRACTRSHLFSLTREKLEEILTDFPAIRSVITLEAEERFALYRKLCLTRNHGESLGELSDNLIKPFVAGQLRAQFSKVPLFHGANLSLLHHLAMCVVPHSFRDGEYVVKKGDIGSSIFFIQSGEVDIIDDNPPPIPADQKQSCSESPSKCLSRRNSEIPVKIYATLHAGDFFGELCLLIEISRSASVISKTRSELHELTKETFECVLGSFPQFIAPLKMRTALRLNEYKKLSHHMTRSSLGREQEVLYQFDLSLHFEKPLENGSSSSPDEEGSSPSSPLLNPQVQNLINSSTKKRRASIAIWSKMSSGIGFTSPPPLDYLFSKTCLLKPDECIECNGVSFYSHEFLTFSEPKWNFVQLKAKYETLTNTLLLMHIFSFLDPCDRFYASLVCKKWKLVNLKGYLKKGLDLSFPRSHKLISDAAISQLIHHILFTLSNPDKIFSMIATPNSLSPRSPRSSRKSSSEESFETMDDKRKSSVHRSISAFSQSHSRLSPTPHSDHLVGPVSPRLNPAITPMLTRLSLKNCWRITDAGVDLIAKKCTSLKYISLFSCWDITSVAVISLANHCRYLTHVNLSNCRKITDLAIIALTTSYIPLNFHSSNLERIELSYCKNLTEVSLDHIVQHCAKLTHLNLQRCTGISVQGFLSFGKHSKLVHLKSMVLSDCMVLKDVNLEAITLGCPNLEKLDLSFCSMLSEFSLTYLRPIVYNRLTHLVMAGCGSAITDQALIALTEYDSAKTPVLESLVIRNASNITDDGVLTIKEAFSQLQHLDIRYCRKVSGDAVLALRSSICKVVVDPHINREV